MKSADVIQLYNTVDTGAEVEIVNTPLADALLQTGGWETLIAELADEASALISCIEGWEERIGLAPYESRSEQTPGKQSPAIPANGLSAGSADTPGRRITLQSDSTR